jgi:Pyruvate/2-oxoacid:ferredoxin oxidoreductase delta subunit
MMQAEGPRQATVKKGQQLLPSCNRQKEFVVAGRLVTMRDREDKTAFQARGQGEGERGRFLCPPEILTMEEVARQPIAGIDTEAILSRMADIGPEARLFLYRPEGNVIRCEVFEDPRVCTDIRQGAVIENLAEKARDVSGWRTHDFSIDPKGCLGDDCGRCAIMCPENAIHLMGRGKGSFYEIDPLACKGCFICWVECVRTAADCILVDGKTFDPTMRAKHFGE